MNPAPSKYSSRTRELLSRKTVRDSVIYFERNDSLYLVYTKLLKKKECEEGAG